MFKKVILTVALVMTALSSVAGKDVKAAVTTKQLTAGEIVTDRLTSDDTEKYYSYTVAETGYFTFSLDKVSPLESADHYYNVYVYDKNAKEIDSYTHITELDTQIYNFQKGETITFKVVRHCSSCKVYDVDYRVQINSNPSEEWEQEKGDSMSDATVLKSGNWMNGTIWTGSDVDFYKFTMDKNGYFVFDLRKVSPLESPEDYYNVYVYDGDANLIDKAEHVTEWTSKKHNFKKGTDTYFKVVRHCSSCKVIGVNYQVKVQSKTDTNWEIEKGDSIKNATTLKSGKSVKASIWTGSDEDYFKFKAPSTGYYYLDLAKKEPLLSSDAYYNIYVLDTKGNTLTRYDHVTYLDKVKHYVKKDTTIVFKVVRHCSSCKVEGVEYSIKVTHKAKSAPSMAKVGLTYKSDSHLLKWKSAKGVDGYEVSISTSSNFKKSVTKTVCVEDNSVTLYGFRYGYGKVYVKVRPYYATVNGSKIYGTSTKAKIITIK